MRPRPPAVAALGLEPGATRADIARAYRRLALLTHPDVSPDPTAAQSFAALTDAYRRALSDADAVTTPAPAARHRRSDRPQFVAGPVHVVAQPPSPTRGES